MDQVGFVPFLEHENERDVECWKPSPMYSQEIVHLLDYSSYLNIQSHDSEQNDEDLMPTIVPKSLHFEVQIQRCFALSLQLVPETLAPQASRTAQSNFQKIFDDGLVDFSLARMSGGQVVAIGGRFLGTDKPFTDAFLCFDPSNIEYHVVKTFLPPCVAAYSFDFDGYLFVFTGGDLFRVQVSLPQLRTVSYKHIMWMCTSLSNLQKRDYFAAYFVHDKLYVHGGLSPSEGTVLKTMDVITLGGRYPEAYCLGHQQMVHKGAVVGPRFKHACAKIALNTGDVTQYGRGHKYMKTNSVQYTELVTLLVFFGGINENLEVVNEMQAFHIEGMYWYEIQQLGTCPPPLHSHNMYACEKTGQIFVQGGIKMVRNGNGDLVAVANRNLYRCTIEPRVEGNKFSRSVRYVANWTAIDICGVSNPVAERPDSYLLPWMGSNTTVPLNQTTALTLGTDLISKRLSCVVTHNLADQGEKSRLLQWLWHCVQKGIESDLVVRAFSAKQPGEMLSLRLHGCILAARSNTFKDLLQQLPQPADGSTLVLDIDGSEYSFEVVEAFVRFLYTGSVELSGLGTSGVQQLLKFASDHGYGLFFSNLCKGDLTLDDHMSVFRKLQDDFGRLFSVPETSNFQDACVVVPWSTSETKEDEENSSQESEMFPAHRVFLCRSQHLRLCFAAGMEESRTGTVRFEQDMLTARAVHQLMTYLYTDSILIDQDTVLEMYIASKIMQLQKLNEFCRAFLVEAAFNPDNVLSALRVAETYLDTELFDAAILYIQGNNIIKQLEEQSEEYALLSEKCRLKLKSMQLEAARREAKAREQQAARDQKLSQKRFQKSNES